MVDVRLRTRPTRLGGRDRQVTRRSLTLVLDASVALAASGTTSGFEFFGNERLIAPPLMWSEARSVLHELLERGELKTEDAEATKGRLERCPVLRRTHVRLGQEAWRIADELGWAKTYDAEYVALALLAGARVVTLDGRLRMGAQRLGCVIGPDEI